MVCVSWYNCGGRPRRRIPTRGEGFYLAKIKRGSGGFELVLELVNLLVELPLPLGLVGEELVDLVEGDGGGA